MAAGPGPGRPLPDPEHRLRPPRRSLLAGCHGVPYRACHPGTEPPTPPGNPHDRGRLCRPPRPGQTIPAWRSSRQGVARRPIDPSRARRIRNDEIECLRDVVADGGRPVRCSVPTSSWVRTTENRAVDWLIAGEAVQRLILEAATLELAVGEGGGDLELPADRARLRQRLGGAGPPQAVLRLAAPPPGCAVGAGRSLRFSSPIPRIDDSRSWRSSSLGASYGT